MRIVIPFTRRIRDLPNQNFRTLMDAFVTAGAARGIRVDCVLEEDVLQCGAFDVLLSIRTLGLQSDDVFRYYRQHGVRIVIWHDDIMRYWRRIPIVTVPRSSPVVRRFAIADLIFLPYHTQAMHFRNYRAFANKMVPMPWSVPDDYFRTDHAAWSEREDSILLSGALSWQYFMRMRISRYVKRHADVNVARLEHPSYSVERSKHKTIGAAYIDCMSKYRYAIATTGYDYTVAKYMEIPAAGCVMMCEPTADLARLGFRDGENCLFLTRGNFRGLVRRRAEERDEAIARAGCELVRTRHVHSLRVRDMLDTIMAKQSTGWNQP